MNRDPKGYFDGEVPERGESYVAPATNRKGEREYPRWRDPDFAEQQRKGFFRLLRLYALPFLIAGVAGVLFLFWALGYASGYLDGFNGRPQRMESNHASN